MIENTFINQIPKPHISNNKNNGDTCQSYLEHLELALAEQGASSLGSLVDLVMVHPPELAYQVLEEQEVGASEPLDVD